MPARCTFLRLSAREKAVPAFQGEDRGGYDAYDRGAGQDQQPGETQI